MNELELSKELKNKNSILIKKALAEQAIFLVETVFNHNYYKEYKTIRDAISDMRIDFPNNSRPKKIGEYWEYEKAFFIVNDTLRVEQGGHNFSLGNLKIESVMMLVIDLYISEQELESTEIIINEAMLKNSYLYDCI